MTWLYILIDIFIVAALFSLVGLFVYLWRKNKPLTRNPLHEFHNCDIYEKSVQDQKRLAHIEEIVEDVQYEPESEYFDEDEIAIDDESISFTGGYGNMIELGDDIDEN